MALPRNKQTDELFESILQLRDRDECYKYFEDLCTVKEIHSFAQRLEVAKLLARGCSYQNTTELTGVSPATIGRVNRCLTYGTGGYKMMLERLGEKGNDN